MTTERRSGYSQGLRGIMSERNLTEADVKAIVTALDEHHKHSCRFSVSQEEFDHVWGNMRALSDNMEVAKKTTTKVIITAFVLFALGAIGLAIKAALAKYLTDGFAPPIP